jgi:hypothetical protein
MPRLKASSSFDNDSSSPYSSRDSDSSNDALELLAPIRAQRRGRTSGVVMAQRSSGEGNLGRSPCTTSSAKSMPGTSDFESVIIRADKLKLQHPRSS